MKLSDNVNNPKHYAASCSLECIDVMRVCFGDEATAWFCLCNAFKYMWRYKNKNGAEDLAKTKWYIDYCTDLVESDTVISARVEQELLRLKDLYQRVTGGDNSGG